MGARNVLFTYAGAYVSLRDVKDGNGGEQNKRGMSRLSTRCAKYSIKLMASR